MLRDRGEHRRTSVGRGQDGGRVRRLSLTVVLAVLLLAGLSPVSAFATDAPGDGGGDSADAGLPPEVPTDPTVPDHPTEADDPTPAEPDVDEADPAESDEPDDPTIAELLGTAEEEGTVRVIVTLRETPAMAGPPESPRRRDAIDAAQQDVLQDLPARVDARGRALASAAAAEARDVRTFSLLPGLVLDVTPAELEALLDDPDVVSVTENRVVKPLLAASGARIGRAASGPYAGTFNGHTGRGWSVAILDSGINRSHFALRRGPGVLHEACFSTNVEVLSSLCPGGAETAVGRGAAPDCSMSLTGCGHGTHVASTAAAMDHLYNGSRLTSVAKDAGIVAIQVFSRIDSVDFCGSGRSPCIGATDADIIAGMNHLLENRNAFPRPLAAVNLSLGSGAFGEACDGEVPLFTVAAAALRDAGIAVVAASGNESQSGAISWPACVSSVISVGSTRTSDDAISGFTNSKQGLLDLMAPGESITAAYQSTGTTASIGNLEGTSMAAPHVAGAFAVLRQADPTASVATLLQLLKDTGTEVSDPWWTGPRIDLAAAVAEVATANEPTRPSLRLRRGLLQVAWRAPARGPVLPTGYTLEVDDGSGWRAVCDPLTLRRTSCTVPAADVSASAWGVPHQVRVRAESDLQPSAWVTVGTATPFTVPDPSAAAPSSSTSLRAITVSWSGPDVSLRPVTRGAPVTQVQVRATQVGGRSRTCSVTAGRTGLPSSCTVTMLTSGVPHTVEVRMRNAAGWSTWAPVGTTTPG